MEKSECKVCVTAGAGYIGSWLVKTLLEKGCTVHATLRNMDDQSKVGLLKSLPDADTGRGCLKLTFMSLISLSLQSKAVNSFFMLPPHCHTLRAISLIIGLRPQLLLQRALPCLVIGQE